MTFSEVLTQLSLSPWPILGGLAAVVLLIGLGLPWVRSHDGGAVVALGAGMGVMTLTFTAVGTAGSLDFRWVAVALAVAALAGYVLSIRIRPETGAALRNAGLAILAVGVLVVLVGGRVASEWDEFSHWLHAVRYLSDYHVFPGPAGHPAIYSCCAAYPYGWPLVGYLGNLVGGFSEATTAVVNVLTLGLFGALIAQLLAPDQDRPSFPLLALGAIGATLLGPTFVSKLVFSNYADSITNVLVGTAAFLVYRLCGAVRDGEHDRVLALGLAIGLTGAAILNVKPANLVLYVFVLGGGVLLLLRDRAWTAGRQLWPLIITLALPAAIYLLWRGFVGDNLQGQELLVRPFAAWDLDLIPGILAAMFGVAAKKGGYFILMLAIVALGIRGLWRNRTELDRISVIVGALFLGYNLFLFFAYVAIFGGYDALRAASYWRYNTHLGLAATLPAAMAIGLMWRRYVGDRRWSRSKILMALPVVVLVVAPVAALKSIRFDIDPTKSFTREILRTIADDLPAGSAVGVYDPEGSGLAATMATYEWRGRLSEAGRVTAFSGADHQLLSKLTDTPHTAFVVVLSGHDRTDLVPDSPQIFVLSRADGWSVAHAYPYPGGAFPRRYP